MRTLVCTKGASSQVRGSRQSDLTMERPRPPVGRNPRTPVSRLRKGDRLLLPARRFRSGRRRADGDPAQGDAQNSSAQPASTRPLRRCSNGEAAQTL